MFDFYVTSDLCMHPIKADYMVNSDSINFELCIMSHSWKLGLVLGLLRFEYI